MYSLQDWGVCCFSASNTMASFESSCLMVPSVLLPCLPSEMAASKTAGLVTTRWYDDECERVLAIAITRLSMQLQRAQPRRVDDVKKTVIKKIPVSCMSIRKLRCNSRNTGTDKVLRPLTDCPLETDRTRIAVKHSAVALPADWH